MKLLEEFIQEVMEAIEEDREYEDIRFDIIRWSKEIPCWCVFVCEHKDETSAKDGLNNTNIYGHCVIHKKVKFNRVVELLLSQGLKVEIHSDYFDNFDEVSHV